MSCRLPKNLLGIGATICLRSVLRARRKHRVNGRLVNGRVVNNWPYFVRTSFPTSPITSVIKLEEALQPDVVDPSRVVNAKVNSYSRELRAVRAPGLQPVQHATIRSSELHYLHEQAGTINSVISPERIQLALK
jgi:hypothetical protein